MPGTNRPPHLALVYQGDSTDANAWSGAPAGLTRGLAEAGADLRAVDATAPGSKRIAAALRLPWTAQVTNPVIAGAAGARASLSLRRGGFSAAVAIGSGYELRTRASIVTFEDMTVAQALAQTGSVYATLSRRAAGRWRARQGRIYESCQACCATSQWAAASIVDDYGIDSAKVKVVGFGRNLPEQIVERDWTTPRFLFIGMDWERKRGPAVLESFSRVRERHPEATLDLVGGHPAISAPGVAGHGVLALADPEGRRRLAALLTRSTCLVMPSVFEPFGMAYLDAGASGVASIGTTNGGAATAIGDGGVLVDPGDRQELLEAMFSLCDPGTAKQLGDRAFRHSRRFTWRAVGERVLEALDKN